MPERKENPEPWAGETDSRDDLETRVERYRAMLGVADLDALTDQLLTLRRARRTDGPRPRHSYDLAGALPQSGLQVVPREPADNLVISWSRKPRKAVASWGLAGRYVKVSASRPFGFARLRFALAARRLAHVYPGTAVVARWDASLGRFNLIPASGYSEAGEYAYAQVTRPGIFTVVGLPRDPRRLLALRLLAALAPWCRAVREGGAPIAEPMFEALRMQPLLREIAEDGALLAAFGYRKRDFRAPLDAPTGDLDTVLPKLPELDLLAVLDDPNRTIRPVAELRLPDRWPLGRRWESLGPANVTGRIKALAMHPDNGDVVYAGAAGGGVWKTTNGGRDWHPTMGRERSLAIGALALAPANPDILYAATGEWTGDDDRPRTPSGMGAGVYRTADGGGHWHLCGAVESFLCTAVAVHPGDADCLYVAGNRGLHRSRDGGITWQQVAPGVPRGPASSGTVTSVVVAPDRPGRVFAGLHRRGVYRSDDGGDSWRHLTTAANGVAEGEAANAPKIALGRNGEGGSDFVVVKMGDAIYASRDGGQAFAHIGDTRDRSSSMIPWCNLVAVDPENDALLFAGGTNLHRSDDGGRSWAKIGGYGTHIHEDQQAIAFHPDDGGRIYLANDGGVWLSTDSGVAWRHVSRGLVAAQAYRVGVSDGPAVGYGASLHDFSAHVSGGERDWTSLGWGEGGSIDFVPGRSDEVYADSQWSNLMRFRRSAAGAWREIENGPDTSAHLGQSIAIARTRPDVMMAIDADAKLLVRRPRDASSDWPVALELATGEFRCVAMAPSDHRHAYAGDSLGRLWHSRDSGVTWTHIWSSSERGDEIVSVAVDRTDARRFYFVAGGAERSSIYRGAIVKDACVVFALDPTPPMRKGALAGTEGYSAILETRFEDGLLALRGTVLVESLDGGYSWQQVGSNLPRAKMMSAAVRSADWTCYLATHGAGVFRASM